MTLSKKVIPDSDNVRAFNKEETLYYHSGTDAKDVNGILRLSSAIGVSGGLLEYLSVAAHLVETYTKEVITVNIFD